MIKAAVIVISDTRGTENDASGTGVMETLKSSGYEIAGYEAVPDDRGRISERLKYYADEIKADIVFTSGGTGFAPRDVTPEATADIIEKTVPGLPEAMRAKGSAATERAYLSRGISGIRGGTLIVNLPGSPGGATQSLNAVLGILAHAVEIMKGGGHQ